MHDPAILSVLETVLYAEDLDAASVFYGSVLGLERISGDQTLSIGFRVSADTVLLIFEPGRSAAPGRPLPSHGCAGPGHIAFRISGDARDAWRARLIDAGIEIEHEETWTDSAEPDARSIYFRDPAGNSVELITADIWPKTG